MTSTPPKAAISLLPHSLPHSLHHYILPLSHIPFTPSPSFPPTFSPSLHSPSLPHPLHPFSLLHSHIPSITTFSLSPTSPSPLLPPSLPHSLYHYIFPLSHIPFTPSPPLRCPYSLFPPLVYVHTSLFPEGKVSNTVFDSLCSLSGSFYQLNSFDHFTHRHSVP